MKFKLQQFIFKKVSSTGLSVFRFFFGLNFLFELIHIYEFRQLYFDNIPYIHRIVPNVSILLWLWMAAVICLIVGYRTKLVAWVNYLFTLAFIASATQYEYHMFYTYTGIHFLMLFVPVSKTLAVDSWLDRYRHIQNHWIYPSQKVSKINYLVLVLIGIGLFYADSAIVYKLQSPLWLKGLGVWLPSSVQISTITDNQWFLNYEILVKSLSYLTMAFEFMFIFLFWNKRLRFLLACIGIGMHLCIYLEFPIPYFALGYVALYMLLIPLGYWEKLSEFIKVRVPLLQIYYAPTNLSILEMKLCIETLDYRKKIKWLPIPESTTDTRQTKPLQLYGSKGEENIYNTTALLAEIEKALPSFGLIRLVHQYIYRISWLGDFLCAKITKAQAVYFLNPPKPKRILSNRLPLDYSLFAIALLAIFLQIHAHHSVFNSTKLTRSIRQFARTYLGVTQHDVFVDSHFVGFSHLYTLRYRGKLLPILDAKGMPDRYLNGGTFAYWMFRVNGPYVQPGSKKLQKGMIDFASFWAHQKGVDLSIPQDFDILQKDIHISYRWKKDLLSQNIDTPWQKIGSLTWDKKQPKFAWKTR